MLPLAAQILIGISASHPLQMGASIVKKWSVTAESAVTL
jgi:hypothetical protein